MILCLLPALGWAQKSNELQYSLLFGLNQPLVLQGFNIEANVWTRKWVFDYSHGFGLQFRDALVTGEASRQQLAFYVPHSTGFGIGYRFTEGLNVRLEPKWHVWEIYEASAYRQDARRVAAYSTFTLGLGAYYRWLPFAKQPNALKGLTIAPSFRWWPNIASTLPGDEVRYFNQTTASQERHQVNNIGMANTPFFVNVSVGYTW